MDDEDARIMVMGGTDRGLLEGDVGREGGFSSGVSAFFPFALDFRREGCDCEDSVSGTIPES